MTPEEEFARDKQANYPSAMPTSGQDTVVTTQDSGQQQASAQPVTGQDQVVTTPQVEYKYDWGSGLTMTDAYNQGNHSWADIYADRYRWGKANNSPVDNFEAAMLFPREHDVQKTKAQNEDDIRKAERKAKFDTLGNFFSHLGNFVGAVGFGGLDIKPEDPVKFSERQQRLKDKADALRHSYNKDWLASLYKQQAEERAAETAKHSNALTDARAAEIARESQRKDALNEANVSRAGAQAKQAESAAALNNAREEHQRAISPVQVETEKGRQRVQQSQISKNMASTNKTYSDIRRNKVIRDRHKIWSRNMDRHKAEAEEFMKANNIHGRDKKNWTPELIDQFNANMEYLEAQGTKTRVKVDY